MKINLGDEVECSITGFRGTAIAKTEHLNGCVQYDIVPKVNKDNEVQETISIDEEQLKVINPKKLGKPKPSGGGQRPKPRGRK